MNNNVLFFLQGFKISVSDFFFFFSFFLFFLITMCITGLQKAVMCGTYLKNNEYSWQTKFIRSACTILRTDWVMTTSSLPVNQFFTKINIFFPQDYDNIMILGSIIEYDKAERQILQ